MPCFKLNPEAGMVFLPGHGRVKPGDVLMGEQFRRFVPHLLTEVPEPPPSPPMETRVTKPKPPPVEAPKPIEEAPLEMREPEAPTSPELKILTEDDSQKKRPATKRKLTRRRK